MMLLYLYCSANYHETVVALCYMGLKQTTHLQRVDPAQIDDALCTSSQHKVPIC